MACACSLAAAIEGCAVGDVTALVSLFDRCGVLAATLTAERVGDSAVRSDIVVGIFLRLWQRAPLYDSRHQNATRWLLREIARALDDVDAPPTTHPLFTRTATG